MVKDDPFCGVFIIRNGSYDNRPESFDGSKLLPGGVEGLKHIECIVVGSCRYDADCDPPREIRGENV